ncbi:hypothetical protein AK830_g9879 [Neonectria ditissima]|uniref:Endoplasmic reticulum junction formation protein lunapark n=1 Tax=Neonectria ditissima TaxID=78410 RepID=A0A0N8H5N7_9HYPO|nr:hypothetical protein AK830_g9879 [Neonectria ditissima]
MAFWPWKVRRSLDVTLWTHAPNPYQLLRLTKLYIQGDSSSTASFEKTLSTLSTKIADTQARLDRVRSSSRRARVLSTIYLSFAYLVYTIVLLLVVGYKNLGRFEWAGLAGGPLLIYVTRTSLAAYYNFRIESLTARLGEYQQERGKTIQKLKDATKYDSTLELIEKYGGQEGKPKGNKDDAGGADGDSKLQNKDKKISEASGAPGAPNRTRMPPPATANIQRRDGPAPNLMEPSAEFAPNAGFAPSAFPNGAGPPPPPSTMDHQQYNATASEPHWYDRIFDVLLGEDETALKNRIVLICKACRLVNGQAPPGTKTLSELGPWKCMSCGALNGELDEGKRIVNEVLGQAADNAAATEAGADDSSSDDVVDVAREHLLEEVQEDTKDGPAAGVRKRRGKGKK